MSPSPSHRITAERLSAEQPREVYHGVLRRFEDGLWGALFFEIGIMAMARSEEDAIRQAIELLEFERTRVEPEDIPVGPITPEAFAEFMAPDPSARAKKKGTRAGATVGAEFTVSSIEYAAAS